MVAGYTRTCSFSHFRSLEECALTSSCSLEGAELQCDLGPSHYCFLFMLCVEAALGPSVPAHAQCEHSADLLGGPCGQQHQGQQPGQRGCHQPALRGRAGHTGACSWCARVCLTREHMESGGCSRETAAPSAPNRPSGAAGVMMFEKPQLHPG